MEATLTTSTQSNSWEIIPGGTVAGIILAVLFIYLFFRHSLFVLMFMDLILGWLRQFNWFPKEGNRMKTALHWVVALVLFISYLAIAGSMGWLQFVPN